ncbi:M14 family metallopeptidase [Gemmatimonadota bacterium]
MSMILSPRKWAGGMLCLALLLGTAPGASAQRAPISFDDYHGYTGTVEYLQAVNRAYPNITELLEIGESTMGRTVYVLVISNMRTGTTIDRHIELRNPRRENVQNVTPMKSYHGKPGQWIDGGTHGNEYTGTEVCLYIIDKLVSGYGSDDAIKTLIDECVFYVCPIVNPDGVYNSVEGGNSQRQNSMNNDDDNDGRINEDGPDDLNGDGHITMFRYKDPEGTYVVDDVDPRVMVRLGRGVETDKERWSMVREDRDNDGDGRRGEDSERGIDVNRNFPEGWYNDDNEQAGSGYYAASAPESRNILEFFTNNTNILLVQSFHTSGGFTYRPFARWPDSQIDAKDLAIFDKVMGKKYCELLGVDYPAEWDVEPAAPAAGQGARMGQGGAPQQMVRVQRQAPGGQQTARAGGGGGARGYDLPREWTHPYNDSADRPYGFGIFIDWAYAQFGSYSMTTELWNRSRDFPGMPEFEGDDVQAQQERWLINYQEENNGGRFFVPWRSYRHPDLGQGEIGGWIAQYGSRNNAFPGDALRHVCDVHWQFELFKANLLPRVVVTEATAEVLYETNSATEASVTYQGDTATINRGQRMGAVKVVLVTATIENTGQLATQVARGARLAGNRNDAVWLVGDRDRITFLRGTAHQSIGVLEGVMPIPGIQSSAPAAGGRGQQQMMMQLPAGIPPEMMQQFMSRMGGAQPAAQAGNTREVQWLIMIEGNSPLKVIVTSQRGGTHVKEITLR